MPNELMLLAWGLPAAALGLGVLSERIVRRGRLRRLRTLDALRKLTWQQWEEVIADAFRRHRYHVREVGGRGQADGGVDHVLTRGGETTVVQAKHWRDRRIGVELVRELYGVQHAWKADHSMFVCLGGYTDAAVAWAANVGMTLVDGEEFLKILESGRAGEPLVLPTATAPALPTCPQCDAPMTRRMAHQGAHAGSEFYGCTRFPQCKAIVPIVGPAPAPDTRDRWRAHGVGSHAARRPVGEFPRVRPLSTISEPA